MKNSYARSGVELQGAKPLDDVDEGPALVHGEQDKFNANIHPDRVAAAHGATLVRCELDGLIATVETTASVAGIPVRARSRAGPPPDGGVSG